MKLKKTTVEVARREDGDNYSSRALSTVTKNKIFMIRTFAERVSNWASLGRCVNLEVPAVISALPYNKTNVEKLISYYEVIAASAMTAAVTAPVDKTHIEVAAGDIKFRPQQKKSIDGIFSVLFTPDSPYRAAINPLKAGRGKSYIAGALIKYIQDNNWLGHKWLFPEAKVIFFTKKPVIQKTIRTLRDKFKIKNVGTTLMGCDVCVTHYGALGTKLNTMCFSEDSVEVFNNEFKLFKYNFDGPLFVVADECQDVKKVKSKRTRFLLAYLRSKRASDTRWLFQSATPGITLNDFRLLLMASGIKTGLGERIDLNNVAGYLAKFRANPNKPIKRAIKDLFKDLGPVVVRPPDDPLPYTITTNMVIEKFPSETEKEFYFKAEDRYLETLEKVGKSISDRGLAMVQFQILAQAEESIKAPVFAQRAMQADKDGFSAIIACRFQETVRDVALELLDAGYKREDLSIIWGGDKPITEKEVFTNEEFGALVLPYMKLNKCLQDITLATNPTWDILLDNGFPLPEGTLWSEPFDEEQAVETAIDTFMENDIVKKRDLTWKKFKTMWKKTNKFTTDRVRRDESFDDAAVRRKRMSDLKIVAMSDEQRQEEIDRFQDGRSKICIFTLAAGGTGLDLDHQDPRARPRKLYSTICYYAEEFIQALGRDARIATLSDVYHEIIFFENTIAADHVLPKLAAKVDCIDAFAASGVDLVSLMEQSIKRGERGKGKSVSSSTRELTLVEEEEEEEEGD